MRHRFKTLSTVVLFGAAALAGGCVSQAPEAVFEPGPIAIHGNVQTFEIAPVLLAAEEFYSDEATVKMGGIPNLVGAPSIQGFGEEGVADVATHAETQALRYSVEHPNIRIVLTVTRGLYRIVARRSAGIETVADLKGKTVATIPPTSSGYFLFCMLDNAGLSFDDIEPKSIVPLAGMTKALANGEVDAVVIWEPYSGSSADVLGDDLIEFSGKEIYSEHFDLNTTAENLADPEQRAKVVAFVRATMDAVEAMKQDPSAAKALVNEKGGFTMEEIERSWSHHDYTASYPDNLLDILVKEEQWLAERNDRVPRSREELSTLIDRSVYEEALALSGE
ncbi:ABC transporter substrate-binding protein [Hyphococcus luteus]|uniref:SsuA/THI5-like domain-containing protein n=1 Tax=Hyphococcus luteus TaxID=2058213 RepID=A0A2S7K1H1_9PROT|nr:ABC transporter substrate-binding protein [Marinicaulis flavus]PQA86363.1 hypothetical protein CW354_18680 [Marinicaulis flavus]